MPGRSSRAVVARRARLIQDQKVSGLSQAEFCRRNGVSLHAFRIWKYRDRPGAVRSAVATPRLLPVRIVGAAVWTIEVVLAAGRTIRVRDGFDERTLERLIATLERASC
jgi:hypothetical protein